MFDVDKFTNTNFEKRTEEVAVAALQDFFPKDEKAVITVQGLTHSELAESREALQSQDKTKAVLEALAGSKPAIKDAIESIVTQGLDVPPDTQLRIMHLIKGSIQPKLDERSAVKLSETFPTEFMMLTNKIMELSGKGQVATKKP